MTSGRDEDDRIRLYLLGKLAGEPRDEFERRLLTDDELLEELLISEDELIDDFIIGDLSPDERAQFEKHFLITDERRQKLQIGKAVRKYADKASGSSPEPVPMPSPKSLPPPPPSSWQQLFSSSLVRGIALAAVILVAALGVWRIFNYQSDIDKGLVALNNAYRERRPIEARFTDQTYAPFVITRGDESDRVDSVSLRRAERYADDAMADNVGSPAHHLLGKIFLARKNFDKAIEELEQAAKGDPQNAQIHSDLGAALLEKGKIEKEKTASNELRFQSGEGIEYLVRSLESFKKALELNPDLLEALFNRALAYEANNLPSLAETDWREYLIKDSASQWAQEAKQRLNRIEEQKKASQAHEQPLDRFLIALDRGDESLAWKIVSENHTSAGNLISNSLLDAYLSNEALDHDAQALRMLGALSFLGTQMVRQGEDHYVLDLINFYRSIDPGKRQLLIEARREMANGFQLFTKSRFTEAIASYTKAKQVFDSLEDIPEAAFANYRIGHCYVLQPNTKRGRSIFDELSLIAKEKRFRWLLAQSLYQLANVHVGLSEYSKAVEYSNEALKLAEDLNDSNGVAKSLIQLADEWRSLNNRNRAFSFLERSLIAITKGSLEPMQAWQSYIGISLNLSSFNFDSAALEFQKEALRLAIEIDRPLIKSRSYQWLALTYANLKMYHEAQTNAQRAIEIGRELLDEPNGMEMIANASVQLGDIYRQVGNYDEAIATYDRSLDLYAKLDFPYYSYAAYKGKLLSYLSRGDDKSAAAMIRILLDFFKQFREKITEQTQRNTFFDAQQSIYDLAIDFEYSRKNSQRAFDYSEDSRGRSLRDLIQGGGQIVKDQPIPQLTALTTSNQLTFSEIQSTLPDNANIIQYAVLANKLLIWVIRPHEALTTKEVSVSASELSQRIQAYRTAIEGNQQATGEQVSELAKELFKILVQPVENSLSRTNLCIVPDKSLHYLPFASLISPKTGKYFFEDYRLQLSPSSTLFLDYSRIAKRKGSNVDEKLLIVGDPDFDHEAFPTLPSLPDARREAETIAEYYNPKTRQVLISNNATKDGIERGAPRADVIHFAAHFVADKRSELLSKLVLAREENASSEEDRAGTLPASVIYKMSFPRTRLVVLAACQTGIEQEYKGEGAISLARPFLARGVPLVVASLWPVDSEATAELMIKFHQYRKQGHLPTATALQQAQRDMLKSETPKYHRPYNWASFVAIGGNTSF